MDVEKNHMLEKNVVKCSKTKILLVIMIILTMLFVYIQTSYGAQTREPVSLKLSNYPGIKERIDELQSKHPNWKFKILYTDLDWSQVIKNETTAWHGRNLVQNKKGEWICSICGDKAYDNGSWRCASEKTVSYYMDPRNFLNEQDIFYFEELSYNEEVQTLEGIERILAGTFMNGWIWYTDTERKFTKIMDNLFNGSNGSSKKI